MTEAVETTVSTRKAAPWWQRILMVLGAILAIAGAAWGAGAAGGTPIAEAADGALAADATLLAPATAAFAIWTPIYAGLLLVAVLFMVPRTGSSPRLRSVVWLVLASMLLNAAWIAVVQQGWIWASVGVLAGIVATLVWIAMRLNRARPDSWVEAVILDIPVGLYLGWATVATVANIAAAARVGWGFEAGAGTAAAVAGLGAVLCIAIALLRDLRPSRVLPWAVTAAMMWGVAWIGLGRLEDAPRNDAVGWAAIVVALGIAVTAWICDLTVALARRHRRQGRAY